MAISATDTPPARPFGRLFSRDALLLAAVFVLVPNLPFAALWLFVAPRRLLAIPLYLLAGMLALRLPLWAGAVLFAAVAVFDVLLIISGVFDLHPILVFEAIRYVPLLDLSGSMLYLELAAVVGATVTLMVWLTRRFRTRLTQASPMLALVCMFAWMGLDARVNLNLSRIWGDYLRPVTAFDSAAHRSHIAAAALAGADHNLLVVTVEGMGAFADPNLTRLMYHLIDTPAVRARYDVSHGTSPYLGSTTGAAARELCGEWSDYLHYTGESGPFDCLPRKLANAGYETIAVHGFTGQFFDRYDWYPKIGFQRLIFGEELMRNQLRAVHTYCGLTFRGFCDRDVADVVRQQLVAGHKRFVYWLTLNTHMPFNAKEAKPRFDCADHGGAFGDKTVCSLSEMWAEVIEKTVSIALDPRLPPTDILIVGDHHTPLFLRSSRALFATGNVVWYALKAKAPPSGQVAHAH